MKKSFLLYTFLLLFMSCGESGPDCLQTSGDTVVLELDLPSFERVAVYERIGLVVTQGPLQKVRLETRTNLVEDITAEVNDGQLILRNENNCNLFRSYGETTVYITVPDLKQIRSSTGFPIKSEGVLNFPDLTILSESFLEPDADTTDGSFFLDLDVERLKVVCNGIAYVELRGNAGILDLQIAAGDSRIDAAAMAAGEVIVDHRGSNHMLVHPEDRIGGVIRGTGDVRSFNRPAEVEVQEIYKGQLIFVE